MPFTYEKPASVDGEWANMRDLAKAGEPVEVRDGFLTEDFNNKYNGEPSPRYIVAGTVSDGTAVKTGVTTGYGRDDFLQQLAAYLKENPDEAIKIRYFKPDTSKPYVDIEVAE